MGRYNVTVFQKSEFLLDAPNFDEAALVAKYIDFGSSVSKETIFVIISEAGQKSSAMKFKHGNRVRSKKRKKCVVNSDIPF